MCPNINVHMHYYVYIIISNKKGFPTNDWTPVVLNSLGTSREYKSASSPLVGFGGLNDNIIKGLTSLLSVEQEIECIAYTRRLYGEKCIKGSTRTQT